MLHVTSCTLYVIRHTSHVTRHTSHVTRHTSHVTRHLSLLRPIIRRPLGGRGIDIPEGQDEQSYTLHSTRDKSHVMHDTLPCVTRHASHVMHYTSMGITLRHVALRRFSYKEVGGGGGRGTGGGTRVEQHGCVASTFGRQGGKARGCAAHAAKCRDE